MTLQFWTVVRRLTIAIQDFLSKLYVRLVNAIPCPLSFLYVSTDRHDTEYMIRRTCANARGPQ